MSICPNSGSHCECQPQDGVMCPHGPTPPFEPWKPEPPMSTDTPPAAAITAEREALAARLRFVAESVRRKPMPLSDFIPLLQQAADALCAAPPAASAPTSETAGIEGFVSEGRMDRVLEKFRAAPAAASGVEMAMEACRLLCAVAVVQENPDKVMCPPAFLPAVRAAMLALRTHLSTALTGAAKATK